MFVRLIVGSLRILPRRLALGIGSLFGRIIPYAAPKERNTALGNLSRAFGGERSDADIRRLAREQHTAVIIATRSPALLQALCQRVVLLRQGQIAADCLVPDAASLIEGEFYRIRLRGELDASRSAWLGGRSPGEGSRRIMASSSGCTP